MAQSVLSEFLASQGYVVAYARPAVPAPLPFEIKTREEKLQVLRLHVGDLLFALRSLASFRNIDSEKQGVISWSYAGESAVLLEAESKKLDLVVSLSSNVLTGWVYQAPEALTSLDPARFSISHVIMTEKVATNGSVRTAPPILDALPTDSYFVVFPELAHGNFNALEGMIPGIMGIASVQPWSKSGPVAKRGYEEVSRTVLAFLDFRLKGAPLPVGSTSADGFVEITRHGKVVPRE